MDDGTELDFGGMTRAEWVAMRAMQVFRQLGGRRSLRWCTQKAESELTVGEEARAFRLRNVAAREAIKEAAEMFAKDVA
jgi:hypothetical protein